MKSLINYRWLIVVLGLGFVQTAHAGKHYMVTDTQTNKVYYTEKIKDLESGSVKLKDAHTGSMITIQNSEVKEIDKKEFKAALAAPAPVAKPVAELSSQQVVPIANEAAPAAALTPSAPSATAPGSTIAPAAAPAVAPAAAPATPASAPAPVEAAPASPSNSAPSSTK